MILSLNVNQPDTGKSPEPNSSEPELTSTSPDQKSIAETLKPYVDPDRVQEATSAVRMVIQQTHSGPLPTALEFKGYDTTLPGAAERILIMTEKEQAHRHAVENIAVEADIKLKGRGQWFALVALVLSLAVVMAIVWLGHPKSGAALGAAIIVGLVAAFLGQRKVAADAEAMAAEDNA